MKMPSTYISLLLLCGLIFIFYYTHKDAGHSTKPAQIRPMVKGNGPMVKKSLPAGGAGVYLSKNQNNGNSEEQTGLNKNGFSFFRDVITHVAPALRN
jgi:hypothetical protein